jgi:hypothetical protein
MSIGIVTDGNVGVGALAMRLAIQNKFKLAGFASRIYEEAKTSVDLDCGLERFVSSKVLLPDEHRSKITTKNIKICDVVIICRCSQYERFEFVENYARNKNRPVSDNEADAPFRHCLVVDFADAYNNTEGFALQISRFLRVHKPTRVFICGSIIVLNQERVMACLKAGIKSALSFA